MSGSRSTTFPLPTYDQWETFRFLISKLLCEEKKTLPAIILHLRDHHDLHASPKTLKTKLNEWGLIKKMNPHDAEDLLAAQARLNALGQTGILVLRGRVEHIKRVHNYRHRRKRENARRSFKPESKVKSASSQVVLLSYHPRLRPDPAFALLTRFESLLREMQTLLHAAKYASMCMPGRITLDWKTSTTESERLERSLYYATWEGTRAYEEGDVTWAGLCWQSAQLTLEDLIWEPDLNVWICFIRCCVRLARFKAQGVAENFLWKLRWLRGELPFSAPHRAFVHALADLPLSDLVDGCLFTLELHLRNVELLWPLERDCHIEYQLHLKEERLYQGLDTQRDMPHLYDSCALAGQDLWENNSIQRKWISTYMLQREYDKAAMITQSTISQLELDQSSHTDNQQGTILSTLLAYWYSLLGAIQYYQDDHTQARISYLRCLQLHQESEEIQTDHALQPVQLRRILVLLRWLNNTLIQGQEGTTSDLGIHDQYLEAEFKLHLQSRENAPLRLNLGRNLKFPAKPNVSRRKNPHKYNDMCSIPVRPRVVQRPVFMSVDRDKDPNLAFLGAVASNGRTLNEGSDKGVGSRPKSATLAPPPDPI